MTTMVLASQEGRADVLRILLQHGAYLQASHGEVALHRASERGHADVVTILLGKTMSMWTINQRDGTSALILASEHGHIEAVNCPVYIT